MTAYLPSPMAQVHWLCQDASQNIHMAGIISDGVTVPRQQTTVVGAVSRLVPLEVAGHDN